jgi:hypothetical protein
MVAHSPFEASSKPNISNKPRILHQTASFSMPSSIGGNRLSIPGMASLSRPQHRILSAFGICHIAAWLAVLQTTSAFVLIFYCWSEPGYFTVHANLGAAVMLAVLSLHLHFLLWPQRMEADARGSMRSALKQCLISGIVKHRLLDNVCARSAVYESSVILVPHRCLRRSCLVTNLRLRYLNV